MGFQRETSVLGGPLARQLSSEPVSSQKVAQWTKVKTRFPNRPRRPNWSSWIEERVACRRGRPERTIWIDDHRDRPVTSTIGKSRQCPPCDPRPGKATKHQERRENQHSPMRTRPDAFRERAPQKADLASNRKPGPTLTIRRCRRDEPLFFKSALLTEETSPKTRKATPIACPPRATSS
jgi:hypothetical protein